MPRIACWRCSGVIAAIASCCSRDGWGMPVVAGGMIRIEAGRLGDALDLGPQHGQEGRVGRALGQKLAPARQRGAAVAALRLVQAEIIEGARIVGPGGQRLGEGLDGGPGHRAVGLERERLAQGGERLGIVGLRGEARARGGQKLFDGERLVGGGGRLLAGDERRRGQAGAAGLQIEAERQQRDDERQRRRQELVQRGVGTSAGGWRRDRRPRGCGARPRCAPRRPRSRAGCRRRVRARSRPAGRDRSPARRRAGRSYPAARAGAGSAGRRP